MMSLTFGLFTQVSGIGPLGPLVALQNLLMHVGRYIRLLSHSKVLEAFPRTCSSFWL